MNEYLLALDSVLSLIHTDAREKKGKVTDNRIPRKFVVCETVWEQVRNLTSQVCNIMKIIKKLNKLQN